MTFKWNLCIRSIFYILYPSSESLFSCQRINMLIYIYSITDFENMMIPSGSHNFIKEQIQSPLIHFSPWKYSFDDTTSEIPIVCLERSDTCQGLQGPVFPFPHRNVLWLKGTSTLTYEKTNTILKGQNMNLPLIQLLTPAAQQYLSTYCELPPKMNGVSEYSLMFHQNA